MLYSVLDNIFAGQVVFRLNKLWITKLLLFLYYQVDNNLIVKVLLYLKELTKKTIFKNMECYDSKKSFILFLFNVN